MISSLFTHKACSMLPVTDSNTEKLVVVNIFLSNCCKAILSLVRTCRYNWAFFPSDVRE